MDLAREPLPCAGRGEEQDPAGAPIILRSRSPGDKQGAAAKSRARAPAQRRPQGGPPCHGEVRDPASAPCLYSRSPGEKQGAAAKELVRQPRGVAGSGGSGAA